MLLHTEVCSVGRRDCYVVFLGGLRDSWPQTPPMTLTEYFLRALSLLLERYDLFGCVFLIIQKLMNRQKGVTKPFSLLRGL